MADDNFISAKRCTKCKQTKHPSEFHRNKSKPDGMATECKPCAVERAAKWFETNKERHRDSSKSRYQRNPESYKQRARAWEQLNRERKRELRRSAYAANREHKLEQSRASWAKHAEKRNATKKAYRLANPERGAEYVRARQSRQQKAMPPWADRKAILSIYAECRRMSEVTGIKHHVDHIYPLKGATVCGLHVAENLRVIPAADNQTKANKFPELV